MSNAEDNTIINRIKVKSTPFDAAILQIFEDTPQTCRNAWGIRDILDKTLGGNPKATWYNSLNPLEKITEISDSLKKLVVPKWVEIDGKKVKLERKLKFVCVKKRERYYGVVQTPEKEVKPSVARYSYLS